MNKQLMAVALAAAAVIATPAQATSVALAADGGWNEFTVDNTAGPAFGNGWIDYTDGSALSFSFTIAAGNVGTLRVVDLGFAGDTFNITNAGALIGTTSSVAIGDVDGAVETDYAAALANPAYSHGVFTLAAGTWSISGSLLQSVFDNHAGADLDATYGAVSLTTAAAVPEASNAAMLLAGLAAAALMVRRRQSAKSN
jgi:MYXO-CTERM domain-containing protein